MDDIFKEIILNRTPGYVLVAVGILGGLYGILKLIRLGQDVSKANLQQENAKEIQKITQQNLKDRQEISYLKRVKKSAINSLSLAQEKHSELKEGFGNEDIWEQTKEREAFESIESSLEIVLIEINAGIEVLKGYVAKTSFSFSRIRTFSSAVVIVSVTFLFSGIITLQSGSTISSLQNEATLKSNTIEREYKGRINSLEKQVREKNMELDRLRKNDSEDFVPLKDIKDRLKDVIVPLGSDVKIQLRDHSAEDGDIVTIRINGEVITESLVLKNKPMRFDARLVRGNNSVEILAENEGSGSPNTAEISVYVDGVMLSKQIYDLKQGEKAGYMIYSREQNANKSLHSD